MTAAMLKIQYISLSNKKELHEMEMEGKQTNFLFFTLFRHIPFPSALSPTLNASFIRFRLFVNTFSLHILSGQRHG